MGIHAVVFFAACFHFTELCRIETLGQKYFLICKKLILPSINNLEQKIQYGGTSGRLAHLRYYVCDCVLVCVHSHVVNPIM